MLQSLHRTIPEKKFVLLLLCLSRNGEIDMDNSSVCNR